MNRYTVGFINIQRFSLHQEIMLLIVHFENADLIVLMVQCHEMLIVRKYTNCFRELSATI